MTRLNRPVALVLPGRITDTALILPPGLSIQKCREIGAVLGRLTHASPWWIGDCLVYAEAHHGELYAQVAAETHLEPRTLGNVMRVASGFSKARRRAGLTFSHHADVLGVENPAAQDRWLAQAEKGDWTRAELRRRLKEEPNGRSSAAIRMDDDPGRSLRIQKALEIIHATRQRLELEQRKMAWSPAQVDDLLNELEAVLYREGEEAQPTGAQEAEKPKRVARHS